MSKEVIFTPKPLASEALPYLQPTATTMNKIDYKKVYREAYQASATAPALVDVPPMRFLMLERKGNAEDSPEFREGIKALFSLAQTIRLALKRGPVGIDFAAMPLEGLWTEKTKRVQKRRGDGQCTLMIMQPPVVDEAQVELARAELARRKSLPALGKIRFEPFNEGRAVQMLHLGPLSEKANTLDQLHRFASREGLTPTGKHHRIYLTDLRKGEPDKWKTILRQPVCGHHS
jgi:hypothetical protein